MERDIVSSQGTRLVQVLIALKIPQQNNFKLENELDTTNMRIARKVDVNFVEETFDITMAPKAKNPEFFNIAIPIKLKGSFEDFGIKIGIVRMAGQIVSFVTSPIHVPIRRVFSEEVSADGVEACKIAWTRTTGD